MSDIKDWNYHPSKFSRFVTREEYNEKQRALRNLFHIHQGVITENVELKHRIEKVKALLKEYPVGPALHNAMMSALTGSDEP